MSGEIKNCLYYHQAVMVVSKFHSWEMHFRFGSLLACESFRADVHAGNLWWLRDGRIGFLDFGNGLIHYFIF